MAKSTAAPKTGTTSLTMLDAGAVRCGRGRRDESGSDAAVACTCTLRWSPSADWYASLASVCALTSVLYCGSVAPIVRACFCAVSIELRIALAALLSPLAAYVAWVCWSHVTWLTAAVYAADGSPTPAFVT